jgi:hypothetical protein
VVVVVTLVVEAAVVSTIVIKLIGGIIDGKEKNSNGTR